MVPWPWPCTCCINVQMGGGARVIIIIEIKMGEDIAVGTVLRIGMSVTKDRPGQG